jgi:hypothetical protein
MRGFATGWSRIALAAILIALSGAAFPQGAQPDLVPDDLFAQDRKDLESRRSLLLQQREALLAKIQSHNGKCGKVPEDSPLVAECGSDHAALIAEIKGYQDAVAEFNRLVNERVARSRDKREQCAAVVRQAAMDRAQIEKQRQTTEASQEELAEWKQLNQQAQWDAVAAGVKFTLGEYGAGIETARGTVSRVDREAMALVTKANAARKHANRMQYIGRLQSTLEKLALAHRGLAARTAVQVGLDAEKAWSVARDTMHHEFRVASKHDEAMQAVLRDPGFREAFTGDDVGTPGLDVLATLAETAGEELGKLALDIKRYEKFTGPTIRAAVFVRDSAYSALLSGLSTQRVLQQSDLAGDLARATAALQKRYQKSIDAVRACRQAG